ncbi:hypothetical protein [Pseudomonas sp. ZS1P83]
MRKLAKVLNQQQPGDPEKLVQAIIILVESEQPPLRLPLGTDSVTYIETKNAFVTDELNAWRELSVSTDL